MNAEQKLRVILLQMLEKELGRPIPRFLLVNPEDADCPAIPLLLRTEEPEAA